MKDPKQEKESGRNDMNKEITEKRPKNGFLPWIISMKVDEHADVTFRVPSPPSPVSSHLHLLQLHPSSLSLLQQFIGLAAALWELL